MNILGMELTDLPDEYTALEAVMLIKALDEDGIVRLLVRYTPSLNVWEAVGMLTAAAHTELDAMSNGFENDE